jgi:pimeloyl-ACP methyl ester carboxylesterase
VSVSPLPDHVHCPIQVSRVKEPLGTLVYLHDEDGLIPHFSSILAPLQLDLIAPQTGSSWWTNRVYQPFDASISVEMWLIQEFIPDPIIQAKPIILAGWGMGGLAALRLAFKYPEHFRAVVSIDAAIDAQDRYESSSLNEIYPSAEHVRQDAPMMFVQPDAQPNWIGFVVDPTSGNWRGNDRLHEKLLAMGIEHLYAVGSIVNRLDIFQRLLGEAIIAARKPGRRLL